jgi:phosphoribosylglycinamide formyltransferase-1
VISNSRRSSANFKAKQAGIPFYHMSSNTHPVPEELDAAILDVLIKNQVDLLILAGYDRKLGIKTLSYYLVLCPVNILNK